MPGEEIMVIAEPTDASSPESADVLGGLPDQPNHRWWLIVLLGLILATGVILLFTWGASASPGGGCGGG